MVWHSPPQVLIPPHHNWHNADGTYTQVNQARPP
jgi:hypothetical protein